MRTLKDYRLFADFILSVIASSVRFTSSGSFAEILSNHPKLIVIFNHSTPLSWIPGPLVLTLEACARGGGSRRPFAIMDRFFYSHPVLRAVAKFISQSDVPLDFSTLVERLKSETQFDLVLFPEGSNCFFVEPGQVGPLRSEKFLRLSFESQVPMLVCAHRGSEHWARAFAIEGEAALSAVAQFSKTPLIPKAVRDFIGPRLLKSRKIVVPVIPKQIPLFELHAELIEPPRSLEAADLDEAKTSVLRALSRFENR